MPIDGTSGFLGLGLAPLSFEETVQALVAHRDAPFAFVVTPNVDHVVKLAHEGPDGPLRQAYATAALRLCDSRILARLARLTGLRLPVVPGSDLTARLFADTLGAGDRVAIVGGDETVLPALRAHFPGPDYVQHVPPMGLSANPAAQQAAVAFVEQAQARYVFLAIGAPQSEALATQLARRGRATGIGLCIGASIEFVTGVKQRAPRWMQRLGIEWLHRLATEPARLWRRYLIEGPEIFAIVLRWRLTGRAP